MNKIMNVGIAAHVDAGKTTITEQMLYLSGAIRAPGSVDAGTTQTDFMEVERKRGISVRAATTVISYQNAQINLIDTPGHVDFAPEVERVLRVIDGAVLVVSAVEGVQAGTKNIWDLLRVPTIFFINKTDRAGADPARVTAELEEEFGIKLLELDSDRLIEQVSDFDDDVMEAYLDGKPVPSATLEAAVCRICRQRLAFPVLCGSAQKGEGVKRLLQAICAYLPEADTTEEAFSGVVFKVEHDKTMGRIAHVRLYGGSLQNRQSLPMPDGTEAKVTQIRKFYGKKYEDTGVLGAGDIGAVYGLSGVRAGDTLGDEALAPPALSKAVPLLQVKVIPQTEADYPALAAAIGQLCAEDPLLNMIWQPQERELLINITGVIQLEVLAEILETRFQLAASFSKPSVIYKETPVTTDFGFVAYTMPKPCWAVIKFLLEPLPQGSGVVYESCVAPKKIPYRYQHQIEQALITALRQGPKGWEVTDLKITLVDGEDHPLHTHPLDFIVATPMAMMDGLYRTGTTLLEPMLKVKITVPEEVGGRLMSLLVNMRARFDAPAVTSRGFSLEAIVPVATSMDLGRDLAAMSSGTATLVSSFAGYEPCSDELGRIVPYRGINPIDQAKYILYIRSALTE